MKRYYKVTVSRIQHCVYTRTIVASSPEEAIALAQRPTAWPTSYDERCVESRDTGPWTAAEITDEIALGVWGDPNEADAPFQVRENSE